MKYGVYLSVRCVVLREENVHIRISVRHVMQREQEERERGESKRREKEERERGESKRREKERTSARRGVPSVCKATRRAGHREGGGGCERNMDEIRTYRHTLSEIT